MSGIIGQLRMALAAIDQELLRREMKARHADPVRAAVIEKRLAPFRTPVTDVTMRRGC